MLTSDNCTYLTLQITNHQKTVLVNSESGEILNSYTYRKPLTPALEIDLIHGYLDSYPDLMVQYQ